MQTVTNQSTFNATQAISTPMSAPYFCPSTLDAAYDQIRAGRLAPALDDLFDDLLGRRREAPAEWPAYGCECLSYPLRELLHQDPFTYRAFSKPRGYAGDAVTMDYIYGIADGRHGGPRSHAYGPRDLPVHGQPAVGPGGAPPAPSAGGPDRPYGEARRRDRAGDRRRAPA